MEGRGGKRREESEQKNPQHVQSLARRVRGLLRYRGRKGVEEEAARPLAELSWFTILIDSRQEKMQGERENNMAHEDSSAINTALAEPRVKRKGMSLLGE